MATPSRGAAPPAPACQLARLPSLCTCPPGHTGSCFSPSPFPRGRRAAPDQPPLQRGDRMPPHPHALPLWRVHI